MKINIDLKKNIFGIHPKGMVYQFVLNSIKEKNEQSVMDFGCRNGDFLCELDKIGSFEFLYGVDLDKSAIELAKLYPEKPIWFSGFSSQISPKGWSEAKITELLLQNLRLPLNRFSFEAKSRNTAENAAFMLQELRPSAEQDWVLLPSASHMKRALASFRAAGWSGLIPYPVDFQTT